MFSLRKKINNPAILIGLAIVLGIILLYFVKVEVLEKIELSLLDMHFRLRGPLTPGGEVVIAAIDERSLNKFGRWPWPRSIMSKLIDVLAQGKSRAIALDVIFSEPDRNSEVQALQDIREEFTRSGLDKVPVKGEAFLQRLQQREGAANHDASLERSIAEAGNVILPLFFQFGPEQSPRRQPEIDPILLRHGISAFSNWKDRELFTFPRTSEVTACIPPLMEKAWGVGHINMMSDIDGVVRWELSAIEYQEGYVPSMAIKTAALYLGAGKQDLRIDFGEGLTLRDIHIGTDDLGRILINYLGPAKTFTHYSVADILEGKSPPSAFRDKIVLVGATAIGIYDLRVTPFSVHFPGVEKHANTLDNILHQRFLKSPSWMGLFDLVAILLFGIFLVWLLPRVRPLQGLFWAFLLLVTLLFVAHGLFVYGNIWIRILYPSLAILFCALGVESYKFFTEEREKRRIRGAFQRYVPPQVVNEILSHPDKIKFGGEKKELTVLFSDIRGFTTYSEKYAPEQVVEILKQYLSAMVEVIFRHQGTLDKFVGDEIMALYGAPIYYSNHAERACLTALDMVAELERLCAGWRKEGKEGFGIGIGINTGEMVVGNLGSNQLFDYTVIGDHVNLGSRLEAMNKNVQTQYHIIISEYTYEHVKEKARVRQLGSVQVKGKTKPVVIYELLGMDPHAPLSEPRKISSGTGPGGGRGDEI